MFFSSDPARFAFRRIIQSGVVVVHLGVVPKTNVAFRSVCWAGNGDAARWRSNVNPQVFVGV